MRITVSFECGQTTCAVVPGVFCPFLSDGLYGAHPYCRLFEREIFQDSKGWLERCPECQSLDKESITNLVSIT